jgi:hypothetical protein
MRESRSRASVFLIAPHGIRAPLEWALASAAQVASEQPRSLHKRKVLWCVIIILIPKKRVKTKTTGRDATRSLVSVLKSRAIENASAAQLASANNPIRYLL